MSGIVGSVSLRRRHKKLFKSGIDGFTSFSRRPFRIELAQSF